VRLSFLLYGVESFDSVRFCSLLSTENADVMFFISPSECMGLRTQIPVVIFKASTSPLYLVT